MLDSLLIKNFRALEHLEVPQLGRVNLLVGKNNAGKSSVLEALRLYAGCAQRPLLEAIAQEHDEPYVLGEADDALPFQALFTGRQFPAVDGVKVEIGSAKDARRKLTIEHVFSQETEGQSDSGLVVRRQIISKAQLPEALYEASAALQVVKGERTLPPMLLATAGPRLRSFLQESGLVEPCGWVPTRFIAKDELAQDWDKVALTADEEAFKRALRIVAPELEDLAFVSDPDSRLYRSRPSRSAKVKLAGLPSPVPLSSMGDGIQRVLQLTLKLLAAKGGFLLIDEFENGLHYSVQEKLWQLIFELSEQLDVQVFATTHSWDCIESFTKVAVARTQTEGVLLRLGRSVRTSDHGKVIATVFDEAALHNITQTDVEVR